MNFVRGVVESAGSLFKEINLQHDVGQDATMVLVVGGVVRPREVALQIKSGKSYVSTSHCRLPATAAHIYFWAEHDLITLGVVYDPVEKTAWWIDLQSAARDFRKKSPKSDTAFTFPKGLSNRFDDGDFRSILVPILVGEAPTVPLERLSAWVTSSDLETHDLGVRIIRARHYREAAAWDCLIEAFLSRPANQMTFNLPIALAKLLFHDDLGFYSGEIPEEIRTPAIAKVLSFGPNEIAKLLSMLPDKDFDRPSLGYSLLPVIGGSKESPSILAAIRDNDSFDPGVRELAGALFSWCQNDPRFWSFWRRDNRRR